MSNAPSTPTSSSAPLHEPEYVQPPLPPHAYDIQLGVGESLSSTFRMWAQSLPKLAVLGFLPNAATIPTAMLTTLTFVDPDLVSKVYGFGGGVGTAIFTAFTMVAGLLSIAGLVAGGGAAIHIVDERERGASVGPFQALFGLTRWGGWLLLAWILMSATWAFGCVAVIGPIFASFALGHDFEWAVALLAIPGLAILGACLWVMGRLMPLMPIIVVEERDLGAAINRAWAMTRGHTGTIIGGAFVFGLVYVMLSMVSTFAMMVPAAGAWVHIVVSSFLYPLAMVFPFAIYAGLVNKETQAQAGLR